MESKANVRRGAKDLQLFERKRIEQMAIGGRTDGTDEADV